MKTFSTLRIALGAAHTSYSMFGARGPMLMPEPSGVPAPGAPAPGAPAPGAPAPAPAPAGDPVFTAEQQAVVNQLIGKARIEGRESAPKKTDTPAAPTGDDDPVTLKSLKADLEEAKLRGRFDKHAAKNGIDDDATEDLFALYKMQKPADDSEWFDRKKKVLGLKASTTGAGAGNPPPLPVTPPISDKGSPAPGGVLDWERELAENPIGMSAAAFQRMVAKHGSGEAWRLRIEASNRQAAAIKVTKPQG